VRFLGKLARLSLGLPATPSVSEKARVYRDLIVRCPACGGDLDKHQLVIFGSVIPGAGKTDTVIDQLIDCNDWSTAAGHMEWEPLEDAIEFNVVACPRSNKAILIKVFFPYSLDSRAALLNARVLTGAETEAAFKVLTDRARQWLAL